jgi:hypothetical protein
MNTSFNLNTEKEFKANLEKVLDSKGMSYILNSLIDICNEKSQHVSENWQDNRLAADWEKTALKIENNMRNLEQRCPNW